VRGEAADVVVGKGQSTIKNAEDIDKAWQYGMSGGRGDEAEVIVEEFIKFESEITLAYRDAAERADAVLRADWTSPGARRLHGKLAALRHQR
jgi:formate-dependent phosphoribosylglycinamide formyltransferase (GAR transformylase)